MTVSDPIEMVDRLGAANLSRDVSAVLACFVPEDDITFAGPATGESATGRGPVEKLLTELFARPAPYGWQAAAATVHTVPGGAFVLADADAERHVAGGATDAFPCRVTGLLSRRASGVWLWRAVQLSL